MQEDGGEITKRKEKIKYEVTRHAPDGHWEKMVQTKRATRRLWRKDGATNGLWSINAKLLVF